MHHVLHARGLYPRELFEARKVFGTRVQKARHPDLESYVEGAVHALRLPIARGDVKRVVLVVKDGDAGGAGNPLERFTFDFLLHPAFLLGAEKPTRADVDEVMRSFAACMAKISFLDAILPPLPSSAWGCTFELVAYATRAGLSRELGPEAWSEERVREGAGAGAGAGVGGGAAAGGFGQGGGTGHFEPTMEFSEDCPREVYPVKSACTSIVNLDVFVERRR